MSAAPSTYFYSTIRDGVIVSYDYGDCIIEVHKCGYGKYWDVLARPSNRFVDDPWLHSYPVLMRAMTYEPSEEECRRQFDLQRADTPILVQRGD